jgi:uncharacterized membrane protein
MIEWIAYFLAYFLAGLSLKLGDDLLDELERPNLAWLPLTLSGVLFGLLMTISRYDLALLVSIIIGVLASGKVNRAQYSIGFILIFVTVGIIGVPPITAWFDWIAIVVMMFLAAVLDEKGNDWADQNESPWAYKFFRYRFTMKVTVILLTIPWPLFIPTALGLWVFDTGYELMGWSTERIQVRS